MTDPRLSARVIEGDGTVWHDGTVIGVIAVVKIVAKRYGYAVAWHGSLSRDLDLVAVPWTDKACEPEKLVKRIMRAVGGQYTHGQENPKLQPHGRLAYAINLHPWLYIDLSVMPPAASPSAERVEQALRSWAVEKHGEPETWHLMLRDYLADDDIEHLARHIASEIGASAPHAAPPSDREGTRA